MSKVISVPVPDHKAIGIYTETGNKKILIDFTQSSEAKAEGRFKWPKGKKIRFVPLSEWLAGRVK